MNEKLFDKFLREYIKDLADCSIDDYDLTEGDINDIVYIVESDEHLWEAIDYAIFEELEKYRKVGDK